MVAMIDREIAREIARERERDWLPDVSRKLSEGPRESYSRSGELGSVESRVEGGSGRLVPRALRGWRGWDGTRTLSDLAGRKERTNERGTEASDWP